MAKQAVLEFVVKYIASSGEVPTVEHDGSFTLEGFDNWTVKQITLANGGANVSVAIDAGCAGLVVVSKDHPFSLRLAGGETLLANGRMFVWWGDDVDAAAVPVSALLFTGNGSNDSAIVIYQFVSTV